ncbi:hypothetical protein [Actinoallomurus soli]|uniref:hypothetical protein n=1 Tax=Actinoallomurus soli TaxID=2952535 RepID=UPI002092F00D|nr:hypothetical protein [Actinoallomurus soli]MCO5974133.1 hypothetical protein [Actinoallomurus soli]
MHGELLVLGVKVAASTVWEILKDAGIDPAPELACSTWAGFLRSQADALLAVRRRDGRCGDQGGAYRCADAEDERHQPASFARTDRGRS